MRESFYSLASLMKRDVLLGIAPSLSQSKAEQTRRTKQRHASQVQRVGSSALSFSWRPYCSDAADEVRALKGKKAGSAPHVVLVTCGLWYAASMCACV